MAQKHLGESSEPLRMVVFPAAKGIATARTPKMKGAFLASAECCQYQVANTFRRADRSPLPRGNSQNYTVRLLVDEGTLSLLSRNGRSALHR